MRVIAGEWEELLIQNMLHTRSELRDPPPLSVRAMSFEFVAVMLLIIMVSIIGMTNVKKR